MKKITARLTHRLGIIAIVAVIGFSFVACGGDDVVGYPVDAPLRITTTTLPDGTVDTAYSQTLTAIGDDPITWSLYGDTTLPAGLSLAAETGVISGTPITAGTSTFTVEAVNAEGIGLANLSIRIVPAAPIITTATLRYGTVGTAYSQTLAATGVVPITWSLDGGTTLPAGLSLAGTGVISGTPTTAGMSTFTVKAVNAAGDATKQLSITIAIPIEMIQIQGGTFTMGSPENEPIRQTDETQHSVTLTGFKMSKHQVTWAQYEAVMGNNSNVGSITSWANRPVQLVTWYDAVEFCNKLSEKEGLTPVYTISGRTPATEYPITSATVTANWSANGYRLPTEAQWEYACRAGTTTGYNTGDNITSAQANYNGKNSFDGDPVWGVYLERTSGVGSYAANAWSLYDMHGNVEEWCWDRYGTYGSSAQTDPTGAVSGLNRVQRGGSWDSHIGDKLRSASRNYSIPNSWSNRGGFRLVRP